MHLLKPCCDPVSPAGHVGVTAGSNERPGEVSTHHRRAEWKVNRSRETSRRIQPSRTTAWVLTLSF